MYTKLVTFPRYQFYEKVKIYIHGYKYPVVSLNRYGNRHNNNSRLLSDIKLYKALSKGSNSSKKGKFLFIKVCLVISQLSSDRSKGKHFYSAYVLIYSMVNLQTEKKHKEDFLFFFFTVKRIVIYRINIHDTYIYIYTHTHTYTYIYIYIYTYIYIHI